MAISGNKIFGLSKKPDCFIPKAGLFTLCTSQELWIDEDNDEYIVYCFEIGNKIIYQAISFEAYEEMWEFFNFFEITIFNIFSTTKHQDFPVIFKILYEKEHYYFSVAPFRFSYVKYILNGKKIKDLI